MIDLETAGAKMIQIDEAALREGLPLRRSQWKTYLDWAVESFRICASGVEDETQIHTHMCYSEFNDIIDAIATMDADVISIETSRSKMELLRIIDAELVKLYFFYLGMTACCFALLASPAEQLLRRQSMPSRYRADRVATCHDIRNNPSLVLIVPLPSTTSSGEDRKREKPETSAMQFSQSAWHLR